MISERPDALFRKIDCLQIPVSDLDAALAFYRDRLGHALKWRTADARIKCTGEAERQPT